MSECTDKKFGRMLPFYELDLLSEEDKEQFELHLYDCQSCFDAVNQFQKEAAIINRDADFKEAVSDIVYKEKAKSAVESRPSSLKNILAKYLPSVALIAAIVLIFVLQPWNIQFTKNIGHADDVLAIMLLQNSSGHEDTEKIGEMVTNLLITDLSESRYIQVLSTGRIYDILRILGYEDTVTIDHNIASQISKFAGAKWIMMGDYYAEDSNIIITSQIIDIESGSVVAGQRIAGTTGDIFSLVDELTVMIKHDLALPEQAFEEPDRQVVEMTSHSREAYRTYLEGVELYLNYYFLQAATKFEAVQRLDSTFAMAYYYGSMNDMSKQSINKAMQYIDNASTRDQYYIRSKYAWANKDKTVAVNELKDLLKRYPNEKTAYYYLALYNRETMDYDSAIVYLKKAIEIDPYYRNAINLLAYSYSDNGDLDKALETINQYIQIAPYEPNPYDSKGEILARNGKYKEAIGAYEKAIEVDKEFANARWFLPYICMLAGEYEKAEEAFNTIIDVDDLSKRTIARVARAMIPLWAGNPKETLERLDQAMTSIELDNVRGWPRARIYIIKSLIYHELGDTANAMAEFHKYREAYKKEFPDEFVCMQGFFARMMAEEGNTAGADSLIAEIRSIVDTIKSEGPYLAWAEGMADLGKGLDKEGLEKMQRAVKGAWYYFVSYQLAYAYYKNGMYEKAINEFKTLGMFNEFWKAVLPYWDLKSHYYLGVCYENTGDIKKAVEQYTKFIDALKDADFKLKELKDARARLGKLQS